MRRSSPGHNTLVANSELQERLASMSKPVAYTMVSSWMCSVVVVTPVSVILWMGSVTRPWLPG